MLSTSQVGKMLDVSYVAFAATIRVQKERFCVQAIHSCPSNLHSLELPNRLLKAQEDGCVKLGLS